ncbi:hypothetical protein [Bacteroides sp.]|uniref:hypothetical protein n=1 Tax=Bacteroides sp. TaxID=29523 RepID=UPI00261A51F6|nr:hypothetical protein [Bacteroides sp.]MDD3040027.1 hypothetical protein [Bacteroides sp.]
MKDIVLKIGEAATYEQLAEEAAELAQAALKVARIIRGENPTPVKPEDAMNHIIEEFTDVAVVAKVLHLKVDVGIAKMKYHRWNNRIDESLDDFGIMYK